MQIGDIVRCIDDTYAEPLCHGVEYTVVACDPNYLWLDIPNGRGWGIERFVVVEKEKPASSGQVGGKHYTALKIQPWDYVIANGLGYLEGSVIKYVSRYKDKGGVEDLEKARHFLDKLIEVEGGLSAR